jgi:hypothetical protein
MSGDNTTRIFVIFYRNMIHNLSLRVKFEQKKRTRPPSGSQKSHYLKNILNLTILH